MLTSKAIGGPRDKIKLSASARWDGLVYKHNKGGHVPYNGRYEWKRESWRWVEFDGKASKKEILGV